MADECKVVLTESEMPRAWYNIVPDMPNKPAPPRHPATGEPVPPEALSAIFPPNIIEQEVSSQREIPIPDEVLDIYRLWRPTPLIRARRFEKALKTPAKIYYKYEGVSPAGSHKLNSATAQVYFNKQAGTKRITTETGAGQWGSALAMACNFFGLACTIYMVKVSYQQKPYRRIVMETFGANVIPSPSDKTEAGRKILAENPNSPGSLGIAISEAVEDTVKSKDTKYSLGSVLHHVCTHQTIVGQETQLQFKKLGIYPDIVIGCVGGGSNFSGLSFPFVRDKFNGKKVRALACEPTACPTLTRGVYKYDFGDTIGMTPLLLMFTLGHSFVPPGIHAGGLRYHGDSPVLCQLVKEGYIEAAAYDQIEVFQAAEVFARAEGIIPAPESAHAVRGAVVEAEKAREEGKQRVILIGLSGHGLLDLSAYDEFHRGKLQDFPLPQAEIEKAIAQLPPIPANK